MSASFTPRSSRFRAATLIELLVALAITASLVASMLSMSRTLTASWRSASGAVSAQTEARRALDQLQRDLEAAVFSSSGVAFAVDTVGGPDETILWELPSPDRRKPVAASWDPERDRFGWGGVWLRFFTSNGGTRAVSYKIVRRTPTTNTGPGQARYYLYRGHVRAEKTFQAGYDLAAPVYNPGFSPGGPVRVGDAAEIQRPRRDSLLANHVVDFGVRLYWRAPAGGGALEDVRIFPLSGTQMHRAPPFPGDVPAPYDLVEAQGFPPHATANRIPDFAVIVLRVLTDEGAQRLADYENGLIEGDWWDIVEAHSKVFTRRVSPRSTMVWR